MLALVLILSTIHILKTLIKFMKMISVQKCNNCGNNFTEWSCDFCYLKSVLSNIEVKYDVTNG